MFLAVDQLFIDCLTGAIADIRLILSFALKSMTCGFIISHNHSSDNLTPSEAEITFTDKIKNASNLMNIKMYDYIIVSHYGGIYYSVADVVFIK